MAITKQLGSVLVSVVVVWLLENMKSNILTYPTFVVLFSFWIRSICSNSRRLHEIVDCLGGKRGYCERSSILKIWSCWVFLCRSKMTDLPMTRERWRWKQITSLLANTAVEGRCCSIHIQYRKSAAINLFYVVLNFCSNFAYKGGGYLLRLISGRLSLE